MVFNAHTRTYTQTYKLSHVLLRTYTHIQSQIGAYIPTRYYHLISASSRSGRSCNGNSLRLEKIIENALVRLRACSEVLDVGGPLC